MLKCSVKAKTPGELVATLQVDGEDEEFTATQLLAMLIGQLQRDAIANTPGVKTDVVISVPAFGLPMPNDMKY